MDSLVAPDSHHLRAAVGWLELANSAEALAELDQITATQQQNADVLEVRWAALAHQHHWDEAAKVARALIAADANRASGWLHHAYALRRAKNGGLLAAFNALAPVADKFPNESIIAYNLACYTCQLHRPAIETLDWLKRAITAGDKKEILRLALADPDLAPLRDEIEKIA